MTNEQYEALSAKLEGLKEIINGDYGVLEATNVIEAKKNEAISNFNTQIQRKEIELFKKSFGFYGFYARIKDGDISRLWYMPYRSGSGFSVFGLGNVEASSLAPIKANIPFDTDEIEDIISVGYYAYFMKLKNGDLHFAARDHNNYLREYNSGMYIKATPALREVDRLFLPKNSESDTNSAAYAVTKNGDLYVVGHGGGGVLYTNSTANITTFSRVTKPKEGSIKKIDMISAGATAASIMLFEDGEIYGVGNNYARQFGSATANFISPTKLPFEGVKDAMLLGDNANAQSGSCILALLFEDGTLGIVGSNQDFHPNGKPQNEHELKAVDEQNQTITGIKQIEGYLTTSQEMVIFALTDSGDLYAGGKNFMWQGSSVNSKKFKLVHQNVERIENSVSRKEMEYPQILAEKKDKSLEIYAPKRSGSGTFFSGEEINFSIQAFYPVTNSKDSEAYLTPNSSQNIILKERSYSPFFKHGILRAGTDGFFSANTLLFLQ